MIEIVQTINDNTLKFAKELIDNNMLVAFPTETVYGLGANAYSDEAIKAIFLTKGRPLDNPLIIHIHTGFNIETLVFDNEVAKKLRKAFIPGPLTLIYKSRDKVSPYVSCGLKALAVRVPSHSGAQAFLKCVNLPIAAPSANISGHISPVTANHVFEDLGDKLSLILDGGRCECGIESTVLDVTGDVPIILRKGIITADDIKSVVGYCETADDKSALNERSPGTKYKHYSPNTKTALFDRDKLADAISLYHKCLEQGFAPVFLCDDEIAKKLNGFQVLNLGRTGEQMAVRLYYLLHECEKVSNIIIGIELNPTNELINSVYNRFKRAFSNS